MAAQGSDPLSRGLGNREAPMNWDHATLRQLIDDVNQGSNEDKAIRLEQIASAFTCRKAEIATFDNEIDRLLGDFWSQACKANLHQHFLPQLKGIPVPKRVLSIRAATHMRNIQRNWHRDFLDVLWRSTVYTSSKLSQRFLEKLSPISKKYDLQNFIRTVLTVRNEKKPPPGKPAEEINGVRVLQYIDLIRVQEELQGIPSIHRADGSDPGHTSSEAASDTSQDDDSTSEIRKVPHDAPTETARTTVAAMTDGSTIYGEDVTTRALNQSYLTEKSTGSMEDENSANSIEAENYASSIDDPIFGNINSTDENIDSRSTAMQRNDSPLHLTGSLKRTFEVVGPVQACARKHHCVPRSSPASPSQLDLLAQDKKHVTSRLMPGSWLDHRTIDFIISRSTTESHVQMHDVGNLENLKIISAWTPRSSAKPATKPVVIPFNLPLGDFKSRVGHWIVFEINLHDRWYRVYDSAECQTKTVQAKISEIGKRICSSLSKDNIPREDWERKLHPAILPQQTNQDDCGVYAIYFCLCLSLQVSPSQCDAALWRKIWMLTFGNQDFNQPRDINTTENYTFREWKNEVEAALSFVTSLKLSRDFTEQLSQHLHLKHEQYKHEIDCLEKLNSNTQETYADDDFVTLINKSKLVYDRIKRKAAKLMQATEFI
jgi:hypothetical protein